MKIKLKDEPVFLMAALCIFFPVGLIFLLRSDRSPGRKWLMGLIGGAVFSALFIPAFLHLPKTAAPAEFQVHVTRESLAVGQSGGFVVTNGDEYYTAFTAVADSDVLKVQDNLYTAVKPGKCTLTVSFGEDKRQISIEVTDDSGTDSIVLASPSGERYHRVTAAHAGSKAVEMTEEEALQSGKTPCKNCYK